MTDDESGITREQVNAQIEKLVENYELLRQGPGTAMLPREVAAGLAGIAIEAHALMSLLYHLCGYAPGTENSHAMFTACTKHGDLHLGCLQQAMQRVDDALAVGGYTVHREFPSCALAPTANVYTQEETGLLYMTPRGNA